MKILRFDDDRIGVLKDEDRVVAASHQEKGPQNVIEEIIGEFDAYRDEFQNPSPTTLTAPTEAGTTYQTSSSTRTPICWRRKARSSCLTFRRFSFISRRRSLHM